MSSGVRHTPVQTSVRLDVRCQQMLSAFPNNRGEKSNAHPLPRARYGDRSAAADRTLIHNPPAKPAAAASCSGAVPESVSGVQLRTYERPACTLPQDTRLNYSTVQEPKLSHPTRLQNDFSLEKTHVLSAADVTLQAAHPPLLRGQPETPTKTRPLQKRQMDLLLWPSASPNETACHLWKSGPPSAADREGQSPYLLDRVHEGQKSGVAQRPASLSSPSPSSSSTPRGFPVTTFSSSVFEWLQAEAAKPMPALPLETGQRTGTSVANTHAARVENENVIRQDANSATLSPLISSPVTDSVSTNIFGEGQLPRVTKDARTPVSTGDLSPVMEAKGAEKENTYHCWTPRSEAAAPVSPRVVLPAKRDCRCPGDREKPQGLVLPRCAPVEENYRNERALPERHQELSTRNSSAPETTEIPPLAFTASPPDSAALSRSSEPGTDKRSEMKRRPPTPDDQVTPPCVAHCSGGFVRCSYPTTSLCGLPRPSSDLESGNRHRVQHTQGSSTIQETQQRESVTLSTIVQAPEPASRQHCGEEAATGGDGNTCEGVCDRLKSSTDSSDLSDLSTALSAHETLELARRAQREENVNTECTGPRDKRSSGFRSSADSTVLPVSRWTLEEQWLERCTPREAECGIESPLHCPRGSALAPYPTLSSSNLFSCCDSSPESCALGRCLPLTSPALNSCHSLDPLRAVTNRGGRTYLDPESDPLNVRELEGVFRLDVNESQQVHGVDDAYTPSSCFLGDPCSSPHGSAYDPFFYPPLEPRASQQLAAKRAGSYVSQPSSGRSCSFNPSLSPSSTRSPCNHFSRPHASAPPGESGVPPPHGGILLVNVLGVHCPGNACFAPRVASQTRCPAPGTDDFQQQGFGPERALSPAQHSKAERKSYQQFKRKEPMTNHVRSTEAGDGREAEIEIGTFTPRKSGSYNTDSLCRPRPKGPRCRLPQGSVAEGHFSESTSLFGEAAQPPGSIGVLEGQSSKAQGHRTFVDIDSHEGRKTTAAAELGGEEASGGSCLRALTGEAEVKRYGLQRHHGKAESSNGSSACSLQNGGLHVKSTAREMNGLCQGMSEGNEGLEAPTEERPCKMIQLGGRAPPALGDSREPFSATIRPRGIRVQKGSLPNEEEEPKRSSGHEVPDDVEYRDERPVKRLASAAAVAKLFCIDEGCTLSASQSLSPHAARERLPFGWTDDGCECGSYKLPARGPAGSLQPGWSGHHSQSVISRSRQQSERDGRQFTNVGAAASMSLSLLLKHRWDRPAENDCGVDPHKQRACPAGHVEARAPAKEERRTHGDSSTAPSVHLSKPYGDTTTPDSFQVKIEPKDKPNRSGLHSPSPASADRALDKGMNVTDGESSAPRQSTATVGIGLRNREHFSCTSIGAAPRPTPGEPSPPGHGRNGETTCPSNYKTRERDTLNVSQGRERPSHSVLSPGPATTQETATLQACTVLPAAATPAPPQSYSTDKLFHGAYRSSRSPTKSRLAPCDNTSKSLGDTSSTRDTLTGPPRVTHDTTESFPAPWKLQPADSLPSACQEALTSSAQSSQRAAPLSANAHQARNHDARAIKVEPTSQPTSMPAHSGANALLQDSRGELQSTLDTKAQQGAFGKVTDSCEVKVQWHSAGAVSGERPHKDDTCNSSGVSAYKETSCTGLDVMSQALRPSSRTDGFPRTQQRPGSDIDPEAPAGGSGSRMSVPHDGSKISTAAHRTDSLAGQPGDALVTGADAGTAQPVPISDHNLSSEPFIYEDTRDSAADMAAPMNRSSVARAAVASQEVIDQPGDCLNDSHNSTSSSFPQKGRCDRTSCAQEAYPGDETAAITGYDEGSGVFYEEETANREYCIPRHPVPEHMYGVVLGNSPLARFHSPDRGSGEAAHYLFSPYGKGATGGVGSCMPTAVSVCSSTAASVPSLSASVTSPSSSASPSSSSFSTSCRMSPPRVYHVVMCTRRYWRVEWVSPETGRRVYKHFGENKYGGGEQAREVAMRFWDEVRKRSLDGVERGEWAGLQEVTRRVREEGVERILDEVTGSGSLVDAVSLGTTCSDISGSAFSRASRMPLTIPGQQDTLSFGSVPNYMPCSLPTWSSLSDFAGEFGGNARLSEPLTPSEKQVTREPLEVAGETCGAGGKEPQYLGLARCPVTVGESRFSDSEDQNFGESGELEAETSKTSAVSHLSGPVSFTNPAKGSEVESDCIGASTRNVDSRSTAPSPRWPWPATTSSGGVEAMMDRDAYPASCGSTVERASDTKDLGGPPNFGAQTSALLQNPAVKEEPSCHDGSVTGGDKPESHPSGAGRDEVLRDAGHPLRTKSETVDSTVGKRCLEELPEHGSVATEARAGADSHAKRASDSPAVHSGCLIQGSFVGKSRHVTAETETGKPSGERECQDKESSAEPCSTVNTCSGVGPSGFSGVTTGSSRTVTGTFNSSAIRCQLDVVKRAQPDVMLQEKRGSGSVTWQRSVCQHINPGQAGLDEVSAEAVTACLGEECSSPVLKQSCLFARHEVDQDPPAVTNSDQDNGPGISIADETTATRQALDDAQRSSSSHHRLVEQIDEAPGDQMKGSRGGLREHCGVFMGDASTDKVETTHQRLLSEGLEHNPDPRMQPTTCFYGVAASSGSTLDARQPDLERAAPATDASRKENRPVSDAEQQSTEGWPAARKNSSLSAETSGATGLDHDHTVARQCDETATRSSGHAPSWVQKQPADPPVGAEAHAEGTARRHQERHASSAPFSAEATGNFSGSRVLPSAEAGAVSVDLSGARGQVPPPASPVVDSAASATVAERECHTVSGHLQQWEQPYLSCDRQALPPTHPSGGQTLPVHSHAGLGKRRQSEDNSSFFLKEATERLLLVKHTKAKFSEGKSNCQGSADSLRECTSMRSGQSFKGVKDPVHQSQTNKQIGDQSQPRRQPTRTGSREDPQPCVEKQEHTRSGSWHSGHRCNPAGSSRKEQLPSEKLLTEGSPPQIDGSRCVRYNGCTGAGPEIEDRLHSEVSPSSSSYPFPPFGSASSDSRSGNPAVLSPVSSSPVSSLQSTTAGNSRATSPRATRQVRQHQHLQQFELPESAEKSQFRTSDNQDPEAVKHCGEYSVTQGCAAKTEVNVAAHLENLAPAQWNRSATNLCAGTAIKAPSDNSLVHAHVALERRSDAEFAGGCAELPPRCPAELTLLGDDEGDEKQAEQRRNSAEAGWGSLSASATAADWPLGSSRDHGGSKEDTRTLPLWKAESASTLQGSICSTSPAASALTANCGPSNNNDRLRGAGEPYHHPPGHALDKLLTSNADPLEYANHAAPAAENVQARPPARDCLPRPLKAHATSPPVCAGNVGSQTLSGCAPGESSGISYIHPPPETLARPHFSQSEQSFSPAFSQTVTWPVNWHEDVAGAGSRSAAPVGVGGSAGRSGSLAPHQCSPPPDKRGLSPTAAAGSAALLSFSVCPSPPSRTLSASTASTGRESQCKTENSMLSHQGLPSLRPQPHQQHGYHERQFLQQSQQSFINTGTVGSSGVSGCRGPVEGIETPAQASSKRGTDQPGRSPAPSTSTSYRRSSQGSNARQTTRTPGRIYSLLVRGVRCWRAEWHEKSSGQRRTRQYAAPKHGEERARTMCLWALCQANCVPTQLVKEAQERFGYDPEKAGGGCGVEPLSEGRPDEEAEQKRKRLTPAERPDIGGECDTRRREGNTILRPQECSLQAKSEIRGDDLKRLPSDGHAGWFAKGDCTSQTVAELAQGAGLFAANTGHGPASQSPFCSFPSSGRDSSLTRSDKEATSAACSAAAAGVRATQQIPNVSAAGGYSGVTSYFFSGSGPSQNVHNVKMTTSGTVGGEAPRESSEKLAWTRADRRPVETPNRVWPGPRLDAHTFNCDPADHLLRGKPREPSLRAEVPACVTPWDSNPERLGNGFSLSAETQGGDSSQRQAGHGLVSRMSNSMTQTATEPTGPQMLNRSDQRNLESQGAAGTSRGLYGPPESGGALELPIAPRKSAPASESSHAAATSLRSEEHTTLHQPPFHTVLHQSPEVRPGGTPDVCTVFEHHACRPVEGGGFRDKVGRNHAVADTTSSDDILGGRQQVPGFKGVLLPEQEVSWCGESFPKHCLGDGYGPAIQAEIL